MSNDIKYKTIQELTSTPLFSHPKAIKLTLNFTVNDWTDLDKKLIKKLISLEALNVKNLPIKSSKKKYYINTEKRHPNSNMDATWRTVMDGIYVDVKYNTNRHIRNIRKLIEICNESNDIELRLATIK